jgi:hypothetical protein
MILLKSDRIKSARVDQARVGVATIWCLYGAVRWSQAAARRAGEERNAPFELLQPRDMPPMSASSEFAPHAARTRSSPRSTSGRQGHRGEVKEVPKEVGVGAGLVIGAAEGDRRVRRDALVASRRPSASSASD